MKKIFKVILILILIIGFIFGIGTIVKFIKLSNIYNQVNKHTAMFDSFYLKTTLTKSTGENASTEAYYRNGVGKLVSSNGIYTWTDGKKAYIVDEKNTTIYTLSLENNIALVSYNMFCAPIQGYNYDIISRFFLAGDVNTTIEKEKVDENDCYFIKTKEKDAIKKVWIDKLTGKIKKAEIDFSNGDIFNYEYELYFNSVESIDVALPDIAGYKMVNGETGNVLTENFNIE